MFRFRRKTSQRWNFFISTATGLALGYFMSMNLSFLTNTNYIGFPQLMRIEKLYDLSNNVTPSVQENQSLDRSIELNREPSTILPQINVTLCVMSPTIIPVQATHQSTPRFHELPAYQKPHQSPPMTTAYLESTVIQRAPWFTPKKICTGTCCAETVAISLYQDDTRIKNTIDGLDLADLLERGHQLPGHLHFHARTVSPEILPCLQPGTIIHADNYGNTMRRWFEHHRLQVTVPYLLITSETDGHTPISFFKERLSNDPEKQDKLLIKWYGINPDSTNVDQKNKFIPFPLGLSKYHEQMPYLTHYLNQTNFANPFAGKENKKRWIQSVDLKDAVETTNILFVKFGINKNSQHRKVPFAMACNHLIQHNNTVEPLTNVSCTHDHFSMTDTYAAASHYLFGLSPPGNGMDCYRTYELWMLGVIPIVQRQADYEEMFQDLPLIQLDGWNYSQDKLIRIMQDYVASDVFQNNDFSGWERLFLRYWRQKVLKDSGRDKDIVVDEQGREYYQAWHYSLHQEPIVKN